jgi:hypothetical protein
MFYVTCLHQVQTLQLQIYMYVKKILVCADHVWLYTALASQYRAVTAYFGTGTGTLEIGKFSVILNKIGNPTEIV